MTRPQTDLARFLFVGALVAFLGWRGLGLVPVSGLDASWNGGLHMGAVSDLGWGRELVFTYGPLGFLRVPSFWYESTGTLALLYTLLTRVALAGGLWLFGRRAFGNVGAALVALVVVPFVNQPLPPLVFGWALWLLVRERTPRQRLAFAVAVGVLGGVELLGKVNIGVQLVALGAVTVAFVPRDRLWLALVHAGATLGGLVVAWLATGQRLLDLNDYLLNAARVASGYSEAMLSTADNLAWHYSAALVVFALVVYGVWTATWSSPRGARTGALLLTFGLAFTSFKSGFVRHDTMHVVDYFSVLLAALVVIPWRRDRRAAGTIAVAAALLAMIGITGERLDRLVDPVERADTAWGDLSLLADPGKREQFVESGRRQVRAQYGLDPEVVQALVGHPIHVEPYETALVWAYDLQWRPAPVYHSYQAYTAELDRLNAELLLSSSAPSRIVMGTQEMVDGRLAGWESPAAMRAILCRYQPFLQRGAWLVLGRANDRCGPERLIDSRRAEWGESVPVPPASRDGMVIVKIRGIQPGLWERLRALAFKGYERSVLRSGRDVNRLVPGTAENGLLLHAPPGVDLPPGFTKATAPRSLAVRRQGGAEGTVRFDFYLVPVAPA